MSVEYQKVECEKCKSKNTKLEKWEDVYSIYSMFICLDCGYIVGRVNHKKDNQ